MRKVHLKNTYLIYSMIFLVLSPFVFQTFIVEHKSFVWSLDGLDQHYQALLYYGRHLRAFFEGKGFPMIDFSVGMGYDVLTTLNYYVIGDPLALFSVFMTKRNGTVIYDFLVILRFYLAGISFCYFMNSFFEKKKTEAIVLGAVIYIFSGYALFAAVRHPFFMNPMIYLPLLLAGMEKILKGKKPYLLITMVFISAISNFYFFYALSIMVVLFVVFRYITIYYKKYEHPVFGFIKTGLRTGSYYLLGIGLSSFILVPVIYAFTRNGRLNIKPSLISGSAFYYEIGYYINILKGWFAPDMYLGYWSVLSFAVITIVSITVILCNHRYWKMRLIYALALLGLCIPAFGIFMNGFSYDANRWCFLLSLLTAVCFSITYEKIYDLNIKEKIVFLVLVVVYGFLIDKYPDSNIINTMFSTLVLFFIIIFCLQTRYFKEKKQHAHIIVFVLVGISIILNGYGFYSPVYDNYASQFLTADEVHYRLSEGVMGLVPKVKKDLSFYRVDTTGDMALNESLTNEYNGISSYYSLMDSNTTSFMQQMENTSQVSSYRFHDLDGRSTLEALCGIKYYLTNNPATAPYGFTLLNKQNKMLETTYMYKNQNTLAVGSMYYKYIDKKNYNKLSALQKQSILLDCVSLDHKTSFGEKEDGADNQTIQKLPVTFETKGIDFKNHGDMYVKAKSEIIINFPAQANTETYIKFKNLKIEKKANTMTTFYTYGNTKAVKSVNVKSSYYNSYFGKNDYLVNLGYAKDGQNEAIIYFPQEMNFSLENIEVYTQSMENYNTQIAQRKQAELKHVKQTKNTLTGEVTTDKKGILFLSIPYSKGWTAYVDGKKTAIHRADTMFMALKIHPGKHEIRLTYQTPYLLIGIVLSFLSCVIFVIGIIMKKKKYRS